MQFVENLGSLFVVATPIGNLNDVTLRAIEVLKTVDTVVCEDTRVTSTLLNKYGIKKPLVVLNEFNEEQQTYNVLKLLENENVALISDAGTPLISDPGFRLIKSARQKGVKVVPIPGASAIIAALSVVGLPTDKFAFLGFLPKSKSKSTQILKPFKTIGITIVLYESPHRIVKTLEAIYEVFGDIQISFARELTKIHEEIVSDTISSLIKLYETSKPKGEFVILFSTKP